MSRPKDPEKAKEWAAKISASKKGCVSTNKGKKFSQEWRDNLSNAHKGLKLSPKARANLLHYVTGSANYNYIDGRSSNPAYRSWQKRKNAHLKKMAVGNFTKGEWETLKAQYDWTCPSCLKREPEIKLSIDHIVPLSKGGSNNVENIQPLCLSCNVRKHTKITKYDIPARNNESL